MTDIGKAINELQFQLNSKEVKEQHYPVQLSASDAEKILALLKEQEPVKAIPTRMKVVRTYNDIEYNYCCGGCHYLLRDKWVACPICGKAVIWE